MPDQIQSPLFYESTNDVLREVVRALGGAKKVGQLMRPEKTMEEAQRWVSDCLNPDRREKFDPDQVLWLLREGRKIGCHAAMNYFSSEAGYSTPLPVEPEDERAKLQREFIESTKALSRMAERIEQLTTPGLRAVSG